VSARNVRKFAVRRRKKRTAAKRGVARRRRRGKKRAWTATRVRRVGSNRAFAKHGAIYDQGYKDGMAACEERMLAAHLPHDCLLPDITLDEAVAAGIGALRGRGVPLLGSAAVCAELESALREKTPYSFIRLGDGELLTLAQEKVLSLEEVRQAGPFLPYAGVTIPDLQARDELAACIRTASLIGVPTSRHPHFQPLLFAVLRAYGVECRDLHCTTSTMNYTLEEEGRLTGLLSGYRLLLIGNAAPGLGHALAQRHLQVAGIVSPVHGYADVNRVLSEAEAYDYDIALIAAGIAAIPLAVRLAAKGKVAIDFGHLANRMAGQSQP